MEIGIVLCSICILIFAIFLVPRHCLGRRNGALCLGKIVSGGRGLIEDFAHLGFDRIGLALAMQEKE